jgi:hypothetical protein
MVPNPGVGSQRTPLSPAEVGAYSQGGTLIMDDRRRRPQWFDGRFLSALDLQREQDYFLTRQADLRRAAGSGVVSGLMVSQISKLASGQLAPDLIKISSGEGVTPVGELVSVPQDVEIAISDIASEQLLNAAFGLSEIPASPTRSRSGLFVLGLRPVEFTANPIASYPTSLTGPRGTQDGDIVEATAVVLVPYPDAGNRLELQARQSRLAREIFVLQTTRSGIADVLPIAMIGMNQGAIVWVDPWMVRREVGSDRALFTLNAAGRATQRAYLLQYDNQLSIAIGQRGSQSASFAATDYFNALPAIGRMPSACIQVAADQSSFTQNFFPQEMSVALSIIPDDEVPTLIESSLSLPPIDLLQPSAALAAVSVFVLMPVARADYAQTRTDLKAAGVLNSIPADPSRRLPLEVLQFTRALASVGASSLFTLGSRLILPSGTSGPAVTGGASTANWAKLLKNQPLAWFVRRRSAATPVGVGN